MPREPGEGGEGGDGEGVGTVDWSGTVGIGHYGEDMHGSMRARLRAHKLKTNQPTIVNVH